MLAQFNLLRKHNCMENKIFLGFGILTVISGILGAVLYKNYIVGVCGTIVGIWLVADNFKKIKEKNSKND